MTLEITIKTGAFQGISEEKAPLYTESNGQVWKAYLEMTLHGVCSVSQSFPSSGTSVDVWHGLTRTWELPVRIKGHVLEDLLTDADFIELLQRVHNGHDSNWNGNNHVGTLDEDADEASDEIAELIDQLDRHECNFWNVWDARDWISQSSLEDVWEAGQTLTEAVEALMDSAPDQDAYIEGGEDALEHALLEKLQERVDEDESFEPSPEQLAALN